MTEGAFDRGEQAVENAPEELGQDAQQGFDNAIQGVKNIPATMGDHSGRCGSDWGYGRWC